MNRFGGRSVAVLVSFPHHPSGLPPSPTSRLRTESVSPTNYATSADNEKTEVGICLSGAINVAVFRHCTGFDAFALALVGVKVHRVVRPTVVSHLHLQVKVHLLAISIDQTYGGLVLVRHDPPLSVPSEATVR